METPISAELPAQETPFLNFLRGMETRQKQDVIIWVEELPKLP